MDTRCARAAGAERQSDGFLWAGGVRTIARRANGDLGFLCLLVDLCELPSRNQDKGGTEGLLSS